MTWLGFSWGGPSTLYPSTPSSNWASQPVAIIPGVAYFTPDATLPAPALNYALYALATECQDLYNNVSLAAYNVLEDVYNSGGSIDSYISANQPATAQAGWNATTYTSTDSVQFGALSIATQVGDIIDFEVSFNLMFIAGGSANVTQFLVMPTLCYNANSTGYVNISQGEWLTNQTLLAAYYMTQNFTLRGRYTVVSGKAGTFLAGVNCASFASNAFTLGLKGTWECKIRHLRAPSF